MNYRKSNMAFSARAVCIALAASVAALAAQGDDPFKMSSLVVEKGVAQRNPTTEIAVGFGDVAHVSPWRVKRRFPRSGGERGGKLLTVRDALYAVNEQIAKDEELPEHTFAFGPDGALQSVCDIPVVGKDGAAAIGVALDGAPPVRITAELLASHARDFGKIEFVKGTPGASGATVAPAAAAVAPAASAPAAPAASSPAAAAPAADKGTARKTGDVKVITLPGGATMDMIWCEPGTFMMGSPSTEEGRFEDEQFHPVTITKGFWLGKYEVTQAQWASVMGENRARFKGDSQPMDNISWEDCQSFIRKVNVALDGVARLPTEAEWEYACRAGSKAPVSGNGQLNDMAWYDGNSGSRTHAVGTNYPNDWGFYDMHGNVLEWCADWFSKLEGQAIDPKGPASGSFRVLRGGCWFFYARDCRSAYRLKRDPCLRNCIYGFRMACSERGGK